MDKIVKEDHNIPSEETVIGGNFVSNSPPTGKKKLSNSLYMSNPLTQGLTLIDALDKDMANEDPLWINHFLANIDDKINVVWELRPVEALKNKYGFIGTPKEERKRIPMRLMLVLDVSHSMNDTFSFTDNDEGNCSKLERMKMFASLLVHELEEDDMFGIVTFGTHAKVLHQLDKLVDHRKQAAIQAIDNIELGGVTNISEGLLLAVDQFVLDFRMITKCPHLDDNIILFTDGMPNAGIINEWDLMKVVQKRMQTLKKVHSYPSDFIIRITTLGTDGFLPEMIYEVQQTYSSDAFHFIENTNNLELCLFRPLFVRFLTNVHRLKIKMIGLNGVEFERTDIYNPCEEECDEEHNTSEEEAMNKTSSSNEDDDEKTKKKKRKKKMVKKKAQLAKEKRALAERKAAEKLAKQRAKERAKLEKNGDVVPEEEEEENLCEIFYIHDLMRELQRHIITSLILPKNHKRRLKDKPVMKLVVQCRDKQFNIHNLEQEIMYSELPIHPSMNKESEVTEVVKHQNRTTAVEHIDKAAREIKQLDRNGAREVLATGTQEIQDYTEKVSELLKSEEVFDKLTEYTQPILTNLEHLETLVTDYNVRWDDCWARLKSISSSIARETPTAPGVFAEGAELFETREIQKRLYNMCSKLKALYKSKGLNTDSIDKYLDVVKELEARWEASIDFIPDPEPVQVFNFTI